MKCPVCSDSSLVMTDRQGVEIDYCPQCRGVWLDRGELDKLVERSALHESQRSAPPAPRPQPYRQPDFVDSDYSHGKHRRKSWLSDFFD